MLVRTPSFFKAQMTADVLERHYRDVADASPVPVLLYNVTMFTGVTLPVDGVARLAEHPNIVGMKESGSDIGYIADCVTRTPDDFTMLAGSATTYFHALCAGCDGGVLALASLFPDDLVRMRDCVQAGKLDEARELQRRLTPIAPLDRRHPRRGRAEGRARSDRLCRRPAAAAAAAGAAGGRRHHPHAARGARRLVAGCIHRFVPSLRFDDRRNHAVPLPSTERILLGPGPSLISPRVMRAMAAPVLSHLDPDFVPLLDDTRRCSGACCAPTTRR